MVLVHRKGLKPAVFFYSLMLLSNINKGPAAYEEVFAALWLMAV